MPPDFLILNVVDGETGTSLPEATVQVNGVTLPYGVEDQTICSHATVACTHGMGHTIPLDFDRRVLSIVVTMDGYDTGLFDFAAQGERKTLHLELEIRRTGTGTARIKQSAYLPGAPGTCN